jgi:hypothetical protein
MKAFTQLLDNFHTDARRLETLQHYSESTEQRLFQAYCAGAPSQQPTSSAWSDFVRARTYGRRFRRVRLVVEPLSTYTKFELEWLYGPNVNAGEEIKVARVEPAEVGTDFWIFDERVLVRLEYDEGGALKGVDSTEDETAVTAALREYDQFEKRSVDLREYLVRVRNSQT